MLEPVEIGRHAANVVPKRLNLATVYAILTPHNAIIGRPVLAMSASCRRSH